MKFTPRKARDDVNVSKEHPLVEAGTLVAGLGLLFTLVLVVLIFLADLLLYLVPEDREVAMFRSWLPEDIATVAYDDPRLEDVESLLARLARHWPETSYEFWIEIHDSGDVNAVALPGGLILVTAGLLEDIQTENELAFVLAHELGHFRNRDHIRGMGRGVVLSMLLAAIGVSKGSSALSFPVADLTLRNFSRRQESAADRFALDIVNAEYGHVADAWRFFERVSRSDGSEGRVSEFLSTHPVPERRIQAIIEYAGESGYAITGDVTPLGW